MNRIKQHSALWRTLKAHYLGANDCASIMGYGFQTIDEVIKAKVRGFNTEPPSPEVKLRMERGTKFEPVVRFACAQRHGIQINETGMKFHKTLKFLTASPDGLYFLSTGEPVLTEFKVLAQLSDGKIPFKYWIQMQIQMAVWDINQCLYCENIVAEDGTVMEFYEHMVPADKEWFAEKAEPIIKETWADIELQRSLLKRTKRKYEDVTDLDIVIHPDMLVNYVRQDPLLDWLNFYGPLDKQDQGSPAFMSLSSRKHSEFVALVQSKIKEVFDDYTEINTVVVPDICLPANISIMSTTINQTRNAIREGRPVIFNACLAAPAPAGHGQFQGRADLLVKNSYLSQIFKNVGDHEGAQDGYSIVMIKYASLELKQDGKSLCTNDKQRGYKAQMWLLNEMLADMSGSGVKAPCGFILGRSYSFSKTKCNQTLDHIAHVIFADDEALHQRAVDWQLRLRDPAMRNASVRDTPELYPNMKNYSDYPWHGFKTSLAKDMGDITLMYRCGPKVREQMRERGVTHWQGLDSASAQTEHFLAAQGDAMPLRRGDIIPLEQRIRFFLDFESVNNMCEDVQLGSTCNGYIFFIGVLAQDASTGEEKYYSFVADNLSHQSELDMLHRLFFTLRKHIDERDPAQTVLPLYYWGNAEKYMIKRAMGHMPEDLKLIDLCKLFRDNKVILPGQFSYGLKEISRLMKKYGFIETTWEEDSGIASGMDAMVEAIRTYRYRTDPKVKSKFFEQVRQYNYVDCKVMQEIVSWHTTPV
jgi:hypothetical protein